MRGIMLVVALLTASAAQAENTQSSPETMAWRVTSIELDNAYTARAAATDCFAKNPGSNDACTPQVVRFMDALDSLYTSIHDLKTQAYKTTGRN